MRPGAVTVLASAALLPTALLLAGCGGEPGSSVSAPDPRPSDLPRHVVVFTPDDLGDGGAGFDGEATWTPTAADVRRADAALRARVARDPDITTPYAGFVRQVAGLADDTVLVNALCDPTSFDWHEAWITVNDGGPCFWQAAVRDGVVVSFSVNGVA